MTDSEREEFVYDLANHYVTRTTKAGLTAMAIDRMSEILLLKSDEELIAMSPPELVMVPQSRKQKRNNAKPKGF
tara:strand:+ start:195 stop:416 length:222 start_codon:yes stop_codon:yes gene_type:complete